MNIVLFDPTEIEQPLPLTDERARHIQRVLRRGVGESFDVGLINGPRGRATVAQSETNNLRLTYEWLPAHPPPPTLTLHVGLPRPQTARDILRDATTLGVTRIRFVHCARSDPNYAASSLWTSGEWHRHLQTGAAQAFDTHLPVVDWDASLAESLATPLPANVTRWAADNYATDRTFAEIAVDRRSTPVALWIGPERGWDDADRAALDAAGVERRHLGARVLRTETAVVAVLSLVQAARQRAATP